MILLALALAVGLGACATDGEVSSTAEREAAPPTAAGDAGPSGGVPDDEATASSEEDDPGAGSGDPGGDAGPAPKPTPEAPDADGEAPTAVVEGDRLVLVDDAGRRELARLDPERDGEVVHTAVRPGGHRVTTVLALARVEDRYELRYLVAAGERVTDLYWFPWRLQVTEDLVRVRDVPPVPVWSPDGSRLAWIEWDERATRLRTVGWVDEDGANNPADEAGAHRLAEVPAGAQLRRWEADGSRAVLVAGHGEAAWRIELGAATVVTVPAVSHGTGSGPGSPAPRAHS